jgi:hypothetical protein
MTALPLVVSTARQSIAAVWPAVSTAWNPENVKAVADIALT